MKITLTLRKPRNPLIATALFRRAGSHRSTERSARQRAHRAVGRELDHMKRSP